MSRSQPLTAVSREQIWSEHVQKELRFLQPTAHYSLNPKTLSYIPDKPNQSRDLQQYWKERKMRSEQEEKERQGLGNTPNPLSMAGSNSLDWVTKYNETKLERERIEKKEEEERRIRGEQRQKESIYNEKIRKQQVGEEKNIPRHLQSSVSLTATGPKSMSLKGTTNGDKMDQLKEKQKEKQMFLDEFLTSLSHTTLSPRSKYNVPYTTSQEIGWDQAAYAMLIEPDKVRPLVTRSDITKFGDEYIAACGVSQFSTKHFKHTSKK